jgi:undecaprenyl-diphosphatase
LPIAHLDLLVDRAFDRLRGRPGADWVAYAASQAADYSLAWHVISVAMAATHPQKRNHSARLAVALGVESVLVNGVIKRLTKRERPALLAAAAYTVRRPKTKSFPSGHASSAALAAVLLSDAMPRLRPLWLVLAATVAASRVHNRMHHASDVVAGAALGAAMGLAARQMWPLPERGAGSAG